MNNRIPAFEGASIGARGRIPGPNIFSLGILVLSLLASSFLVPGLCSSDAYPASSQEAATGESVLTPQQLLENLKAKKYSGKRIDLQMSKVSLQAVMAEMEKASGFVFDMDPRIGDKVTYHMRNVPWDEALAVVLSENALRLDLDMEGDGFKVYRGDKRVVAFHETGKWKLFMFLYSHLFTIIIVLVAAAALLTGFFIFRRRKINRRTVPAKALLAPDVAQKTKKKLLDLFEVEKIYRQEQLTLQSLARELSVTTHQLSWIINTEFKISFPSLVNSNRVKEVKSRLLDPNMNHSSILQAAFEAGFSTKAAFNRAFKKFTGMTPSQLKKASPR